MNTNITIRSQLFEYYSNTELFAHLCCRHSGTLLDTLRHFHASGILLDIPGHSQTLLGGIGWSWFVSVGIGYSLILWIP